MLIKLIVLTKDFQCPVAIEDIEEYIQILMPAYQLNLGLQGSNSSIGDVLPGIMRLRQLWSHMEVIGEKKELIYFLLHFLQKKFSYEFKSPIYHVI